VIHTGASQSNRKAAYNADITYGQNDELGFDYLRDNMKFSLDDYVHRYLPTAHDPQAEKLLHYAIIDEVDSVLIDEARTPLIISGSSDESTTPYLRANGIMPFLKRDLDFIVDEKGHTVSLTESGVDKIEARLGIDNLYAPAHMKWVHYMTASLKAHNLYRSDKSYLVDNGKVVIIDEHTGRKMPGRRWSDGIHQAIEAKEGLEIQEETQTLATITFQNYFRMYEKLSGMTGTAETEAEEFAKVYDLDCLVVPTNKPIIRDDREDLVYKNERGKFKAVIEQIAICHERGQPVLVGTISVEKSSFLSHLMDQRGIPHHVLNAKNHEAEAEIVAQAGRLGSVTIATNMAGRGTDIILGGNPDLLAKREVFGVIKVQQDVDEDDENFKEVFARYEAECSAEKQQVLDAGGLAILGTERHESRRIDNQLRGRAGRQGDPGMSQFYLSLEDDLMRVFGGDRVGKIMEWLDIPEDEAIVSKSVSKAIESSQERVEGQNFDARKNLLEYDNVMNQQRKTIYALRRQVMSAADTKKLIESVIDDVIYDTIDRYCPEDKRTADWNVEALEDALYELTGLDIDLNAIDNDFSHLEQAVTGAMVAEFNDRRGRIIASIKHSMDPVDPDEDIGELDLDEASAEHWQYFERETYLRGIDEHWKEHLRQMDALKEGVFLNAYAQKDPKLIYKKKGFDLFQEMVTRIRVEVTHIIFRVEVKTSAELDAMKLEAEERRAAAKLEMQEMHADDASGEDGKQSPAVARNQDAPAKVQTLQRARPKMGRNDACWCGSGKKYKKCHMKTDEESMYQANDAAPPPA